MNSQNSQNSQNTDPVRNKSKPTFAGVGKTFQELEDEIKMLQQSINEHPNPQTNSDKALVKNAYDKIAQIHHTLTKAANFNDTDNEKIKSRNLKQTIFHNTNTNTSIKAVKHSRINKNLANKHANKLRNKLERRESINSTTQKQSLFNRFRNTFRKRSTFNNLRNNLTNKKGSNKLYTPLNKLKGNLNIDEAIISLHSKFIEPKQIELIKEKLMLQKINNLARRGKLERLFKTRISQLNRRKNSVIESNYIESNRDKLARNLLQQLENLENDDDIQVRDNMSLEELEAQLKLMDERTKKIDEISRSYI